APGPAPALTPAHHQTSGHRRRPIRGPSAGRSRCRLTETLHMWNISTMPRKPNSSRQTRAVLAAFLDRGQAWRYGYDLAKETRLKSGTLYPVLMRLSEQGLLDSRWQEPERAGLPPRPAYRPTAAGR